MDVGTQIKDARKSKGLTQIEVAQKAGIAVNSLRLYEANKRQPRLEQIKAIAAALDTSPLLLMGYVSERDCTDLGLAAINLEETTGIPRKTVMEAIDATPSQQLQDFGSIEAGIETQLIGKLSTAFRKLNIQGQQKAVERVEELAEIPKYQRTEDP